MYSEDNERRNNFKSSILQGLNERWDLQEEICNKLSQSWDEPWKRIKAFKRGRKTLGGFLKTSENNGVLEGKEIQTRKMI